jgi:hypothetical protein
MYLSQAVGAQQQRRGRTSADSAMHEPSTPRTGLAQVRPSPANRARVPPHLFSSFFSKPRTDVASRGRATDGVGGAGHGRVTHRVVVLSSVTEVCVSAPSARRSHRPRRRESDPEGRSPTPASLPPHPLPRSLTRIHPTDAEARRRGRGEGGSCARRRGVRHGLAHRFPAQPGVLNDPAAPSRVLERVILVLPVCS